MNARTLVRHSRASGDQGAVLILALIFVLAVGLVLVALGDLAGGALLNTSNLRNQRTSEANAENAAMVAVQQVRSSFTSAIYMSPPQACPGSGAVTSEVVNCIGTWSPGANSTRRVQFYVCASALAASCTSPTSRPVVLYAVVTYDDVPANNPGLSACNVTFDTTCGISMTINQWDVRPADN